MSSLVTTGFIIIPRGIIVVRGDPATFAAASREISEAVASQMVLDPHRAMTAVELTDLAKSTLDASRDSNLALGATKLVGSTAFGTGVGLFVSPFVTPLGGAAVGFMAGKLYEELFDYARNKSENTDWSSDLPENWDKSTYPFDPEMYRVDGLPSVTDPICSRVLLSNPDPLVKTIKYVMVDPLVLDLDGDGLEITPLSRGVQFDGNGDTIRTNTSWVQADDGLLVLDRNGNGVIDSGRELFGDETLLADGKKAAHGFAALAELDVGGAANATGGAGDGVFDAKDAQYTNVRIWRDLNQDGISQANELQTLAEAGIASVKLSSTKTDTSYGDAQLVQSGSFTRTDGSEGQAGSFIFAQNNAVTTHAPIAISAAAQALPAIQGSGWVRDLQGAATLKPHLLTSFGNAQAANSRAGFVGGIAQLLLEWGNDSDYVTASEEAMEEDGIGLILRNPASQQEIGWMNMALHVSRQDREAFRQTLSPSDLEKFDTMRWEMVGQLEKLYAYEAFTGYTFLHWDELKTKEQPPGPGLGNGRPVTVDVPLSEVMKLDAYAPKANYPGYKIVVVPEPIDGGKPHIDMLWDRLVAEASMNMMPSMRLNEYSDMVQLSVSDAGVALDFSQMDAALDAAIAANAHEGVATFLDLYRTYGKTFREAGWSGEAKLRTLMQTGVGNQAIQEAFAVTGHGSVAASSQEGSVNDDSYVGDASANTFDGKAGNDLIDGLAGDDVLSGGSGDDVMFGGDGNDVIYGGDGADVLDGGTGNDYLDGGLGNNTYLFGKGDGQDKVAGYNNAAADKLNTLQFKQGVLASEISLKQVYDTQSGQNWALEVSIAGTTDTLVIEGFFVGNDPANATNPVQQFKFADGTTWDLAAITAKLFAGTSEADTISGTTGNDTISGGAGNDSLSGLAGDDTYVFGLGAGADTISDYDSTAGNTDVLSVGAGVAADQLWFRRVGASLEVSIIGTDDKSNISNWYSSNSYHIEQFKTADGKVLTDARVQALVDAMAAFSPPAAGQTTLPSSYQAELTPVIAANWQ